MENCAELNVIVTAKLNELELIVKFDPISSCAHSSRNIKGDNINTCKSAAIFQGHIFAYDRNIIRHQGLFNFEQLHIVQPVTQLTLVRDII